MNCREAATLRRNMKKPLLFVRRTRILLQCDNVVVAMPSLGVSSLDLGPLAPQAASFLLAPAIVKGRLNAHAQSLRIHNALRP